MTGAQVQEMLYERERRKCAPDWDSSTPEELADAFEYWCRKYIYIRFPGKGKIPFELRPAQRETVELWLENRYTVALKARQIGFSTLVSIFSLWLCFFWDSRTIILVSKGEREAQQLLTHARYAVKFLPTWMLNTGPLMQINKERILFSNESEMDSAPSASDPARGRTAFKIVVDEFGQLPNDDDAWASIEPVADQGGAVIMLGTANGEGNLFHKTWVGSKGTWSDYEGNIHHEGTGQNQFASIFHGWWTGGRDQAWYDAKTANMEQHHVAQEYPSNPDEAFLKSGRPVFDIDALRKIVTDEPAYGWLDELDVEKKFNPDASGPLGLWEPPLEGEKYTIGVDVAEGLEYGDYSSCHVIKASTGEVVATWHGHIDPDLLGTDVAAPLGRWYNRALVLVESNNHGLTTLTALRRENYNPLYSQKRLGTKGTPTTQAMGWRTTASSKPLAIDELNKAIRDGGIQLYCSRTIAELRTYVRDERGRMHGSPHDDRVMSLAIAAQGLKYVYLKQFQPEGVGPLPGTIDWHLNIMRVETPEPGEEYVGSGAVA